MSELNYQRHKNLLHDGAQMWSCMDCGQAVRKYGNGNPDREEEIMYLTCENCTVVTKVPSATPGAKGVDTQTFSHHPHRFAYVIERRKNNAKNMDESQVSQDVSATD